MASQIEPPRTTGPFTAFWGAVNEARRAWIEERIDRDGDGRPELFCPNDREADMRADASNDVDGDYALDTEDSCPGIFNPCQRRTDADGDGIDDDCEHCPADAAVRIPLTELVADMDVDGVADVCDCDPMVPSRRDTDGDLIADGCDICPADPDTGQADCDGDGVGDACSADVDDDGAIDVCGFDNCPPDPLLPPAETSNPDQANCNEDAESVLGRPLRGDVCDDTPCGETRVEARTVRRGPFDFYSRTDVIRIDALATVPMEARTGVRFCPCAGTTVDDPRERTRCQAAFGCEIANTTAYDDGEASAPPSRWRETSHTWPFGGADGAPLEIFAGARPEVATRYAAPTGSFVTDLSSNWSLFTEDVPRWDTIYGFDPGGLGRHPGVLWTHTPGPSAGGLYDDAVRPIASHYWSGIVEPDQFLVRTPIPCSASIGPYLAPETCAVCAAAFPEAFISVPGALGAGGGLCRPNVWDPFLDLRDGLIPAGPRLPDEPPGPGPDAPWVFAAEPSELLTGIALRHVVLDAAGGIAARMVISGGALVVDGGCPPQQCDPVCPGPNCPFGAARALGAEPPFGGALPVLSARRGELFWVGLVSAGRELVRALDVGSNEVRSRDVSIPLGALLAATYLPASDSLLVLDELVVRPRRGRERTEARLLVIDPDTGVASVIALWRRGHRDHRFALAAAPDGSVYLAASGERGAHVVVRLDVRAGVRVLGWALGARPIIPGQAHASSVGVSLGLEGRGGALEVEGYRAELLRRPHPRVLPGCF